jgi:hypothetical protein
MTTSIRYPHSVISLSLILLSAGMSGAVADDFEQPAILKASDVIGDKLLRGEYHVVDDAVRNDGYLNYYVLRSDYGDWEVTGTALLAVRVREVEALATLDEVSKTEVFVKAAADAGVGQLKAVTQFATHPVESVKGIPSGIGRMFKRYKRQAGDAVETTKEFVASDDEDNVEAVDNEDGSSTADAAVEPTEGYFGVSSAQRAWAQELGTDPYSNNETLQAAIKQVAWADRLGRFGMKFASIPEIPGADVIGEVNDVVWSKDPYELEDLNRARLAATGADDELIEAYLESPHFTPTQLTYLTAALTEMDGVKGRDGILRQALIADTEAEVGFFVKSVTMLAWYHLNKKPLVEVYTDVVVPRGVANDGTVTLLFAADYVFWTDTVAEAADGYAALRGDDEHRVLELWLLGGMSERMASELAARNITAHTDLIELGD